MDGLLKNYFTLRETNAKASSVFTYSHMPNAVQKQRSRSRWNRAKC